MRHQLISLMQNLQHTTTTSNSCNNSSMIVKYNTNSIYNSNTCNVNTIYNSICEKIDCQNRNFSISYAMSECQIKSFCSISINCRSGNLSRCTSTACNSSIIYSIQLELQSAYLISPMVNMFAILISY